MDQKKGSRISIIRKDTRKKTKKVLPFRRSVAHNEAQSERQLAISKKKYNLQAETFNVQFQDLVDLVGETLTIIPFHLKVVQFVAIDSPTCITLLAVNKLEDSYTLVIIKDSNITFERLVGNASDSMVFVQRDTMLCVTPTGAKLYQLVRKVTSMELQPLASVEFPFVLKHVENHVQVWEGRCFAIRKGNTYYAYRIEESQFVEPSVFVGSGLSYKGDTFYLFRGDQLLLVDKDQSMAEEFDSSIFQKEVNLVHGNFAFQGLQSGNLFCYEFREEGGIKNKLRLCNRESQLPIDRIIATQDETILFTYSEHGKKLTVWNLEYQTCGFDINLPKFTVDVLVFKDQIYVATEFGVDKLSVKFGNVRKQQLCSLREDQAYIVKPFFRNSDGQAYIYDSDGVLREARGLKQVHALFSLLPQSYRDEYRLKSVTLSKGENTIMSCFTQKQRKQIESVLLVMVSWQGRLLQSKTYFISKGEKYGLCHGYFYIKRELELTDDLDDSNDPLTSHRSEGCSILIVSTNFEELVFNSESAYDKFAFCKERKALYGYSKESRAVLMQENCKPPFVIGKVTDDVNRLLVNEEEQLLFIALDREILFFDMVTLRWLDDRKKSQQKIKDIVFRGSHLMYAGEIENGSKIWVQDGRWKQVVFQTLDETPLDADGEQVRVRYDLDHTGRNILHFSNEEVWIERVLPDSSATLTSFFNIKELVNIKAVTTHGFSRSALLKLVQAEPNNLKYYFNAAVLFGDEDAVQCLLQGHSYFQKDGLLLKELGALQFSMLNNYMGISKMLIAKCQANQIYNNFGGLRATPDIVAEYILGLFFPVSIAKTDFPYYARVRNGTQPIFSHSRYSCEVELGRLDIDSRSDASQKVRYIKVRKPIDISNGSLQLLDILECYRDYASQALLNSDASLLVSYLAQEGYAFELVEAVLRAALLAFNIYAVFSLNKSHQIAGIVLSTVIIWYELMTFKSLRENYSSAVNWMDLFISLLCLATFGLGLAGGKQVVLSHFTVLFMLFRAVFTLKVFGPLKHFFQILIEVVAQIIPFTCIIIILIVSFAIDAMLVPVDKDQPEFGTEVLDSLKSMILTAHTIDYLSGLSPEQRFVKWFIIFARQLLVAVFLLNGILVGIVNNVYNRGQERKRFLFFTDQIESLIEIHSFHRKLKLFLACFVKPKKKYLHAFVTNFTFEDESNQTVASQIEPVLDTKLREMEARLQLRLASHFEQLKKNFESQAKRRSGVRFT